jgi:predicted dithiol-disulfide oxidoreductase (DUF899 family)
VSLWQVVSPAEWQAAREALLAKEKEATQARDALAVERRGLPIVRVEEDYVFEDPRGEATLLDMFEGRRQLIIYHFMFAPDVKGWPTAGCPGCSTFVDQLCQLSQLHAHQTSFALVSRALPIQIEPYKQRKGWDVPWYSSSASDFNADFGISTNDGETFGLSVFIRDDDTVFRTYFTSGRGVEALGSMWTLLDLTPLGRQGDWEH